MSIMHHVSTTAPDLIRIRHLMANLYLQGSPEQWVLIDAGLYGGANTIAQVAEAHFGTGAEPAAIILTHGHFDHVGSLKKLLGRWDVPVYAHANELPFLTGERDYPRPDPTVGRGAMAVLSFAYPRSAIDLGSRVRALPGDGTVPGMPGWRWIETPGHSAGHVSLFRGEDGVLIAGDAFVTVQQESFLAVARQKQEVHGPPAYFTPDWIAARDSVVRLATLRPTTAATGHGTPMSGAALQAGLDALVARFDELAVPDRGRYVPKGS
jgi:glyoxylase-like metal-dependent hydrolase (beta-lactamase superfamily II)